MAGAGCSTAAPAGSQTRRFRRRIPRPGTVFSHQQASDQRERCRAHQPRAIQPKRWSGRCLRGPLQGLCVGWRAFPMLNVPVHGPTRPEPLLRSIKRHLYAENCSARTPHHLLIAVRQADTFLRGRGTSVHAPPGPTSRRSWACSSARACSARAGSRDGCAASSSSARSLGPPALPWVPLTGRRPRPRTRPRPSADQPGRLTSHRDQRRQRGGVLA
jgi:hypothetical protein